MTLTNAFVAVRSIRAGQALDPDAPDYHPGAGGPQVPWPITGQLPGRSWSIKHPGGTIEVRRMNAVGGRILVAMYGPKAVLDAIAEDNDEMMSARTAWRRRADDTAAPGEASPQQIVRAWPTWRCDVWERNNEGMPILHTAVVRVFSEEGVMLPLPGTLPWDLAVDGTETTQALAARRVTVIHWPAMHATLAGHAMHVTLEDEPDPGA